MKAPTDRGEETLEQPGFRITVGIVAYLFLLGSNEPPPLAPEAA
jgi:hypothetical protein